MKRLSLTLFLFIALTSPALAWPRHGVSSSSFNGGLSQGQFSGIQTAGDDAFINELKGAQQWTYLSEQSVVAPPSDLDVNGYPLNGAVGFSHGGFNTVFFGPSQAERPGTKTILAGGAGKMQVGEISGWRH